MSATHTETASHPLNPLSLPLSSAQMRGREREPVPMPGLGLCLCLGLGLGVGLEGSGRGRERERKSSADFLPQILYLHTSNRFTSFSTFTFTRHISLLAAHSKLEYKPSPWKSTVLCVRVERSCSA